MARRCAYVLLILFLAWVAPAQQHAAGRRSGEGREVRDARTGESSRRTLDEMTLRVFTEPTQSGGLVTTRVLVEPVPYDEYLAAVRAEENDVMAGAPSPVVTAASSGTCTPGDSDWDGDGWTGALDPRPYIADEPRVITEFPLRIAPYIEMALAGTTNWETRTKEFTETSLSETRSVKDTIEVKKTFNSTNGLKLGFGFKDSKPSFSLDFDASQNVNFERTHSTTWSTDVSRTTKRTFTDEHNRIESLTWTLRPDSGRIDAMARIVNRSDSIPDHPTNIEVTQVRLAFVVYDPLTGDKSVVEEKTITETIQVFEGPGVNSHETLVQVSGYNTSRMLDWLRRGFIFDVEVASYPVATVMGSGEDIRARLAAINNKTVQYSIHFGDAENRVFGKISRYQPGDQCLTARALLETVAGAGAVVIEPDATGTPVVTEIAGVRNMHTDRDFDELTPEEKDEFGRWVVGYSLPGRIPPPELDLETTVLKPGDVVFFYYITAADFAPPEVFPDIVVEDVSLRNDGQAPQQADDVVLLNPRDRVRITVANDFEIENVVSRYVGSSRTCWISPARVLYDITEYNRNVQYRSLFDAISIPNPDYYGVRLRVNDNAWMTIAAFLSTPGLEGVVLGERGFPHYDYSIAFTVTEPLLANLPTGTLSARQAKPRQSLNLGFTGRNLNGTPDDCRATQPGGFMHSVIDIEVYRDFDGIDLDGDSFFRYVTESGELRGIDFDDGGERRFPYAPEHLDGVDNDGDAAIDESPLRCPASLPANAAGTCRLDDRMGWYGSNPAIALDLRTRYEDGSMTPWQALGGVDSYPFVMSTDPDVEAIEVRATHWPAGGGSFSGTSTVARIDPGVPVVHAVGETIEAESGALTDPMQPGSDGVTTWVHVPAGTADTTGAAADYQVEIPTAGDYEIWTRVYATDPTDDSFLVDLLDPAGQRVDFGFGAGAAHFRLEFSDPYYVHGSFGWTRVGHYNVYVNPIQDRNPVIYALGPGVHTIRFRPRELGTRLDALRVDRVCVDADGDGWTDCAGDCNDSNAQVFPGRGEVCSTTGDDDCDGFVNEGCGGTCRRNCDIEQMP